MPELKLDSAPLTAVKRAPIAAGGKVFWTLRAVYPAPYGTVWLRYWETEHDEYFDVLTAGGTLLQRSKLDPSVGQKPPLLCQALYLEPGRQRGPLLYLKSSGWHHFYAFPDGFSGFLSENSDPPEHFKEVGFRQDKRGFTTLQLGKERRYWRGIRFAEEESGPAILEGDAPRRLPLSPTRERTRFVAVYFDRVYYLRWVTKGEKAVLQILDKTGRRIAQHPLRDTFGASPHYTFLDADWADDRRKRQPVVIIRDSDQVRVYVFADGLRDLLISQDFNDSSTSISATTVSFGRDKDGLLTVSESYSERGGEDGSGGASSETNYRWTGKEFR